jgi:hypothetical protein
MKDPDSVCSRDEGGHGLLSRIEREAGVPGLVEILAERLAPTDLQSLLLEVYRRRARQVCPGRLLDHYARNRFVRPAHSDPKGQTEFDRLAFRLLPEGYEVVELSPVSPLGAHSVIATVDQNKVVTTSRNTEVVSDPTNVLAIESALRRREVHRDGAKSEVPLRLCASHRVLRGQRFDEPGAYAHFRLLGLTAAGRDRGSHRFEIEMLLEQLDYFLRLVGAVGESGGSPLQARVAVTDLTEGSLTGAIEEGVLGKLAARHPGVELGFDPARTSGRRYYVKVCFKIHCLAERTDALEVGDGGFTDWTQQLLSNRKERLLIGCVSGERILRAASGEVPK